MSFVKLLTNNIICKHIITWTKHFFRLHSEWEETLHKPPLYNIHLPMQHTLLQQNGSSTIIPLANNVPNCLRRAHSRHYFSHSQLYKIHGPVCIYTIALMMYNVCFLQWVAWMSNSSGQSWNKTERTILVHSHQVLQPAAAVGVATWQSYGFMMLN